MTVATPAATPAAVTRARGYALFEMIVVAAVVAILLVFAGLRPGAAERLADATRQNLAAQGRLYLNETLRLRRLGYFGRARQSGGTIRAVAPRPLSAAAVEHLAGALRGRDFPADRRLAPEQRVFSFESSSAGVVVTLALGRLAGDLGAEAPPDAWRERRDDGGWSWIWRATPALPGRARRVMERLYRPGTSAVSQCSR